MNNNSKVTIHLVSNTHCDKEYLFSGPKTRSIVVRIIDELLKIFKENPEYQYFHLDGQTSPLATYLSIKPEKEEELKQLVKSGKLLIGPWHTLPDMFQISGESIIRNLLYGHQIANDFGKAMKVGYNIFGWGQISQLPQIYKGFDIDGIIFYRGINEVVSPKLEFNWHSPDDSEVLGIRYGEGYRLNFFHFIYLPVVFGRCHWGCQPYNWERSNGILFHLCDEYSKDPNSFLIETKRGFDTTKIPESIGRLLQTFANKSTTSHYLASMGWDIGMPYPELPNLIKKINEHFKDEIVIIQSTLPDYIEKLKSEINYEKLELIKGEMRHENCLKSGGETYPPLLASVLSARIPINLKNTEIEISLEKWAEPISVFAWMCGREYSVTAFDEAWLTLFTNHSHDCIGGTHTDVVYNSIMERYSHVFEIAETESYYAIQHISKLIDTSYINDKESVLIVFNPMSYERTEIVHAHIDTPVEENYTSFTIEDENGESILPQINYDFKTIVHLHQVYDYPLLFDSKRFDFYFEAKDIPPFGYKTFRIKTGKAIRRNKGTQVVGINTMQNEYLRVKINNNGTLNITNLKTGQNYPSLCFFEDRGEIGGPCCSQAAVLDRVINSLGEKAEISLLRDGANITKFQVDISIELPTKVVVSQKIYPFPQHMHPVTPFRRSETTVLCKITNCITLLKGHKRVDVVTAVDNKAEDHRLRIMFPINLDTNHIDAESQFDVVARKIRKVDSSQWHEDAYHTQPHRYFLDVNNGEEGLAIITKGTHEYEFLDYENKTIAVTLLRCLRTGPVSRTDPEEFLSQCKGKHTFSFAIYPHEGNWEKGNVYEETYRKHIPLRVVQMQKKKGILPSQMSFFKTSPVILVLSTIKLSERGNSIIIRFHNPTDNTIEGSLESFIRIEFAREVNLEEIPIADLSVINDEKVKFTVSANKIFTLEIFPNRS